MSETTEIEKKSLEAHVELCAQRYRHLETHLESLQEKIDVLFGKVVELGNLLNQNQNKNNDRLIAWGTTIIATLLGVIGWLFVRGFMK